MTTLGKTVGQTAQLTFRQYAIHQFHVLLDWLGFNGTFSTMELYRAFKHCEV